MRLFLAGVPNRLRKFTVADIAFVEIHPSSDAPAIFAEILSVSGTNSATWNVVWPNISWGLARTFNEYRRISYSPIGAVDEMGVVKSKSPSDCRDMFFSTIVRPRASDISTRTGTPANDLKELFFIIAPIITDSPGRYMPRSVKT